MVARKATRATALRGVLGILARPRMTRPTRGELATTYPPMITMAICRVKGISCQKPSPKYFVALLGVSPTNNAPRKTITIAPRANTKASGNQRSAQSAIRTARREKPFATVGPDSGIFFPSVTIEPRKCFRSHDVHETKAPDRGSEGRSRADLTKHPPQHPPKPGPRFEALSVRKSNKGRFGPLLRRRAGYIHHHRKQRVVSVDPNKVNNALFAKLC